MTISSNCYDEEYCMFKGLSHAYGPDLVLTEFHQVTTKLIPNNIDLLTSTELSQYQITKWQLVYYDEGIW